VPALLKFSDSPGLQLELCAGSEFQKRTLGQACTTLQAFNTKAFALPCQDAGDAMGTLDAMSLHMIADDVGGEGEWKGGCQMGLWVTEVRLLLPEPIKPNLL
jgi:hypothetical protein